MDAIIIESGSTNITQSHTDTQNNHNSSANIVQNSQQDGQLESSDNESLETTISRESLSSSFNSQTNEQPKALLSEYGEANNPQITRIRSFKDIIKDDIQSILKKEEDEKDDMEAKIQKEFSIEDAFRIKRDRALSFKLPEQNLETLGEHPIDPNVRQRRASTVETVYTNHETGDVDLPPDGGYGWVCCLCAFLILFSTWGNNCAFGIYLTYYNSHDTYPGATAEDFAWIAGLIVATGQFFAPFAMIADRMLGFKTTMTIACFAHFAGYLLSSFATRLWQLYVCQGVIVGMAYSFLTIPATTIVPDWFLKNRGLASGLLCGGTGLGGLVYTLSINAMIENTGNQVWSLRMVAIVSTVTNIGAIIFIKRRNQPPRQKINFRNLVDNMEVMFDMKIMRTPILWHITLWFSLATLGYNMVLFSYSSSATALGMSESQGSTLTALINTAQTLGRPLMGLIADQYVGRVNHSMLLNFVIIILIFAFWVTARSFAALLVCGFLLGLFLAVAGVMNTVLIADAFEPDEFAPAWALLNMVLAFFIVAVSVIANALKDDSLSNPYLYAQIFSGCSYVVALIFLVPLREWHVRNYLTRRRDETASELQSIENGLKKSMDVYDLKSLEIKLETYDKLLSKRPDSYLKRATYPIKI